MRALLLRRWLNPIDRTLLLHQSTTGRLLRVSLVVFDLGWLLFITNPITVDAWRHYAAVALFGCPAMLPNVHWENFNRLTKQTYRVNNIYGEDAPHYAVARMNTRQRDSFTPDRSVTIFKSSPH